MDLIYKKADVNDIDELINLKIKQNIYNCNEDGLVFNNVFLNIFKNKVQISLVFQQFKQH